jgi:DNA-binding NarL/FixJ family response regulator
MNAQQKKIRVLCVDDHEFLAEGLRSRLASETDLEFSGWLSTAEGLVEECKRREADVVLMDIDMPGPDPFVVLNDLHRACPDVRTIMLSGHLRDSYIDTAFERGAWGYFLKSDPSDALMDGIRKVAGGECAFSSDVDRRTQGHNGTARAVDGATPVATPLGRLTEREHEVLRLIGKGMSRADIARALYRSAKTVDAHHTSIMKKLDIHDRADLVRYAIREGLVEP